jgi:hypothetical protein
VSRTPPARPYPRTISSPDCADPPVRRGSGKAHRPHGAIERARTPGGLSTRVPLRQPASRPSPTASTRARTSDPTLSSSPNHLATAQVGDLRAADSEGARQPRSQARRSAPIKTDRRGSDTKLRLRCPTRREATEEAAGHEGGLRHQPRDPTTSCTISKSTPSGRTRRAGSPARRTARRSRWPRRRPTAAPRLPCGISAPYAPGACS